MSLEIWGDFSMVGPSNPTANPFQDRQACINFYPEISPSQGSKVAASLLTCPGLVQVVAAPGGGAPGFTNAMTAWPLPSSVTNLPVRGLWVLPGRLTALAVIGPTLYLLTMITEGNRNTPGSISMKSVGTLSTNSGFVSIRDNGFLGGVAVIVDNPNGYYYVFGVGASTTQPVGTFAPITDPAWLGAKTVAYIDGWWIFGQPNSQTFFTNRQPYSLIFNGTYFANKDSFGDRLVAVFENKEQLWLLGEMTTEIWYDAGGQYFPFQRVIGTELQMGCKAAYSIARLSLGGQDSVCWLARSERGENLIVRTRGLNYEVVSTPAVSDAIAGYSKTDDAFAYVYQEDTHEFYVITFPTADRTWVYDATMPTELAWHERASYDPYAQSFHRHRSNCFANFAGMRLVGDYQNGALYQMTRAVANEAGWPLYRRRRAAYIWDKDNRERAHITSLQVEFAQATGASSGLGANPVAYLSVGRDNGISLGTAYSPAPSNTFPAPMSMIGQTLQRTIWRKLGWGRWVVPQIDVIAPVNSDIIGATLKAFGQ